MNTPNTTEEMLVANGGVDESNIVRTIRVNKDGYVYTVDTQKELLAQLSEIEDEIQFIFRSDTWSPERETLMRQIDGVFASEKTRLTKPQ